MRTEGYVEFAETEFPGVDIDWEAIEADDSDDDFSDDEEDPEADCSDGTYSNSDAQQESSSDDEEDEQDPDEEKNQEERQHRAVRRSGRQRQEPDRFGIYVSKACATKTEATKLNYREAMKSDDQEMYRAAVVEYLRDLLDTKAVEVVPRPSKDEANVIRSRWVCYKKFDADGNFIKAKVRWTPFGFMQKKNVDYTETFAPVAISSSNRLIYVLAARWKRPVKKGDVENAFQRTVNTQKTIYAELCEGIELVCPEFNRREHVLRLNHAINGTKQSGREFNDKLDNILRSKMKMRRLAGDPCVYTCGDESNANQLVVACHVDDYQYVGMNEDVENKFEEEMQKHLPSKIGKTCEEHLGVKIEQHDGKTRFTQQQKIVESCRELQITAATRKMQTLNFNGTESEAMEDAKKYRRAIGQINHIVHNSRPDVMPVASLMASYTSAPTKANWRGVAKLLAYMLGTKERGVCFPGNSGDSKLAITAYSDASYNSPNENLSKRKTQSRAGYLVFINGCLVKWYSKLIRLTPQSSEEAEVIALNELVRFLKWQIKLLIDMNIPFAVPKVYCDNTNAVAWVKSRAVTDRTKHFEAKLNLCRDSYVNGDFKIEHIDGVENPADLMTKQLSMQKVAKFSAMLGMEHQDGSAASEDVSACESRGN